MSKKRNPRTPRRVRKAEKMAWRRIRRDLAAGKSSFTAVRVTIKGPVFHLEPRPKMTDEMFLGLDLANGPDETLIGCRLETVTIIPKEWVAQVLHCRRVHNGWLLERWEHFA